MAELPRIPFLISWIINRVCNLRCKHCYLFSDDRNNANTSTLSTQDCFKIIDELSKVKVFQLGFAGAEPLLRRDIFDIARYARSKGLNLQLLTNGTLVNEENSRELQKIGFDSIQVSLDGSTPETHEVIRGQGTFEKTVAGIRWLVQAGLPVIVSTVIMKSNKDDVRSIIRKSIELGCASWRMEVLLSVGRGRSNQQSLEVSRQELKRVFQGIRRFEEGPEGDAIEISYPCYMGFLGNSERKNGVTRAYSDMYSCGAGVQRATLLEDGSLVACDFLQEEVLGNVLVDGFERAWTGNPLLRKWRTVKPLGGKCGTCALEASCGGGCRAGALLSSGGDFWAEDPLCWIDEPKREGRHQGDDSLVLPAYRI